MQNTVITEEGAYTVDRGWLLHACTADACQQGRAKCPCRDACALPEDEGPGLMVSPVFWIGGAIAVALWLLVCILAGYASGAM